MYSAGSGCAELRSLAGQRLDPAPVARGHGVLRGDPRAADAGDIGQGEKVRGTGQVDAPGGTEPEVRHRSRERLEVSDPAGVLGREELAVPQSTLHENHDLR